MSLNSSTKIIIGLGESLNDFSIFTPNILLGILMGMQQILVFYSIFYIVTNILIYIEWQNLKTKYEAKWNPINIIRNWVFLMVVQI